MTTYFTPQSEKDVVEVVSGALVKGEPLAIQGGATRRTGARLQGPVLSTRGLSGITLYEPSEMVISARAGTPLAEVEATLAQQGQMLPFEPMDHRPLLGTSGTPTIGAIAAANISGPRRVVAGAARDHLIGLRMVNGYGEIIKSGGRVMKNVTGLDLVKLNAGALGTLGVLTEVTFKVLPLPEARFTLCAQGLSGKAALIAMADAMATPFEVNAAAYSPQTDTAPSQLLFRIEGLREICSARATRLATTLAGHGNFEIIGDASAVWKRIGNAGDFATDEWASVLRVHVAPSKAPAILDIAELLNARVMIDWAGGLIWLGLGAHTPVTEAMTRIAAAGGYPVMARIADPDMDLDHAMSAPIRALARRVKHAFDPHDIFNRGLLAGYL